MKHKFLFPFLIAGMLLSSCNKNDGMIPYNEPTIVVDSLGFSTEQLSVSVGKTATLNLYMSGNAEPKWMVKKAGYIEMEVTNNSAEIRGIKAGSTDVIAYAGDKMTSCTVTVTPEGQSTVVVNSISLDRSSTTMYQGEEFNLTATVNATGGTPTVTFAAGKTNVISVSKQNDKVALVRAIGVGEDIVTVTAGDKIAYCSVTVQQEDKTFSIKLNKDSMTLVEGSEETLTATVYPSDSVITWDSDDKSVATVTEGGKVKALKAGSATISASITKDSETKTAVCLLTVTEKGGDDDYESKIAAWSQPGHLYMHYLRTSDTNYDKWAVWIWQNFPKDLEGSLWGASNNYTEKMKKIGVTSETIGHMTKADCGGAGTETYMDQYGIVIDIDLTKEDLRSGKSREVSPLVSDWTNIERNALGFLIVDQSAMNGDTNWVSDGSSETYIYDLGDYLPDGKLSYMHVYCVEGNVYNYTTTSGKQEFVNPTATDKTGAYRSNNDITNLKYDAYPKGIATSTTFLEDRPGTGYQIFVPSFADSDGDGFGDLRGIINKLDYLDDLGIKVLWLTPIQQANSYHGYDVTDYYKINPKFGTLQDYQELIYKAHEKGMKVLMDMVINHTSKSNVLFKKSQVAATEVVNGKTINYRDMYLWKYEGDEILQWNGVEGKYDETNPAKYNKVKLTGTEMADWYRDGTSNYFYYGKFGSGMAELNYSCQATRDYMTDMCKYWLSFGLDGFRLDAIKHIYLLSELDTSYAYTNDRVVYDVSYKTSFNTDKNKEETRPNDYSYDIDLNVNFWKQFAGSIKSAYPNCFLVGENYDGWNQRISAFYEAIDSQFDFSTYYHVHESTGSGIVAMGGDIQTSLDYYYGLRGDRINGAFTSNHDVARFINHSASTVADHHVEVNDGNKQDAINRARWAGSITMLTPGVSWIYYGDEIGLSGNINDKVPDSHGKVYDDHGNNIDRWYRQPMRWGSTQGQDMVVKYTFNGIDVLWDFYNQKLDTVSQQQAKSDSLYTLFKNLCKAKNSPDYPTYGYIENSWAENSDQNFLCMHIKDNYGHSVYAFVNGTGQRQNISSDNQGVYIWGSDGSAGNGTYVPAYGFTVVKK